MFDTVALIVAAGRGVRAGGDVPKQFALLAGRSVIQRAVDAFAGLPVFVVSGAGQEAMLAAALDGHEMAGTVAGGATRRESVANGLAAITAAGGARQVLVHDAARPLLPRPVIDRLLAALANHVGALPALRVADTLVRADAVLGDVVDRRDLWRVQTPQAFDFDVLVAAHAAWPADVEATDDAQMVRALGHDVAIVEGDAILEKITAVGDFTAAAARLNAALVSRSATGYDVHRLETGETLWLGGIEIAHTHGLSGHSDADVALHALTDALLGTIGAGDIGTHFPPSDARWRGASSDRFLAHAAGLVRAVGVIDFVDLTIVCEAPKIGPHRDAIRARIAAILQVPVSRISVKATTTERLGFTGRREGIAAMATATVRAP